MSSSTSEVVSDTFNNSKHPQLFLREIPGDYGLPFIGPIKDRLDYFYNQGQIEFFRSRATKYMSTVFRVNMPPGAFIASNSKVVVLLDANSFPVLFDTTKVEKKNILDGTFMPSTSFFGGYRPCAFLDPSEPKHAKLKQLFLSLLASLHDKFIPTFQTSLSELFNNIDSQVSTNSTADFNVLSDNMSYDFVFRLFFNINPTDTKLGSDGQGTITNWLALQLAPIATLGLATLPNCLEDFMLRTFKLPFFPVKSGYKKFYQVIYESSTSIFEEAEKLGLKKDEVCHNLIFLAGFNAFGGMKRLFPSLIKWIGIAGPKLHKQLADEIRGV
ncbi:Allene oxide synthase, partial [Thalictrum thalictroides]